MLRFLLLTLTLCLGCALAIGAAVAVGRMQPPSEMVQLFHMNDCEAPCFLGVTLGKTRFEDAKKQLEKLNVPNNYIARLEGVDDVNHNEILMSLSGPINSTKSWDASVVDIEFKSDVLWRFNVKPFFHYPTLTLADIVAIYGIPTCAYTSYPQDGSSGYWEIHIINHDLSMNIHAHGTYLMGWDAPVRGLALTNDVSIDPCRKNRWKGITTYLMRPWGSEEEQP
ncbi:MAG: hypothetical protein IT324_00155 [Anaerolineae bacterium]|nr:hypothetical protein [Anaerolineae bacterium]